MDALYELLRTHDSVTFDLEGIGQTYCKTSDFKGEVERNEKLIEIGKATEKAFEQCDFRIDFLTSRKDGTSCLKVIRDIDELLEWSKEE